MTKIEQLAEKGYIIHKGWFLYGRVIKSETTERNFMFYIVKPNGEMISPQTPFEKVFYLSEDKIPCTRKEIVQELYNPTEEQWCVFYNHFSLKTEKYLEKIERSIGLEKIYTGEEDTLLKECKALGDNTFLSKVENKYILQTIHQYEIDAYGVVSYVFDHYPKSREFDIAYAIYEIRVKMNTNNENYRCWECCRRLHWTEAEGNFLKKYRHWRDRFCGCSE